MPRSYQGDGDVLYHPLRGVRGCAAVIAGDVGLGLGWRLITATHRRCAELAPDRRPDLR